MNSRLSDVVTGLYDRLYSWLLFTFILLIMIWCILYEVTNGKCRRK
jgi:hypothetical protein